MANEIESLTLERYLRGCVGFTVPDDMIMAVAAKRGLSISTTVADLEEKELDLAEAELLYRGLTLPSVRGSIEDADGNWKHKEGQTEIWVNDKKMMLERANDLRVKWGEEPYARREIKIMSFGIERRRPC